MVPPRLVAVPQHLPVCIQPLAGELLSSWLRRLAAANATTLEELLAAVSCVDSSFSSGNMGFDYQLPEEVRHRLSVFCRIPASKIAELEISNAFVGHRPEWFFARQTTPYRPHLSPSFCLPCLAEQIRGGCPLHVQAAWAMPILTHCPLHLVALQALCPSCWIHDPVNWLAAHQRRIILCRRCSKPLTAPSDKKLRGKGLLAVISLESAILAAMRGESPDSCWAGTTSAECFMRMIRDLTQLLTHRESGEGSMVAKQVAPEAFRCAYSLPRGLEEPSLFTLHHSVRLMVMAAIAQFVLGHRRCGSFPSTRQHPTEQLATFPRSWQLTASELRFVQDHFAGWPEQLQLRFSVCFSERGTVIRREPSAASGR